MLTPHHTMCKRTQTETHDDVHVDEYDGTAESDRDREKQRQRETHRHRHTDTDTETQRERQRERALSHDEHFHGLTKLELAVGPWANHLSQFNLHSHQRL